MLNLEQNEVRASIYCDYEIFKVKGFVHVDGTDHKFEEYVVTDVHGIDGSFYGIAGAMSEVVQEALEYKLLNDIRWSKAEYKRVTITSIESPDTFAILVSVDEEGELRVPCQI